MSMDYKNKVLFGDALEKLKTIPDETVQMCVTSPPYWGLRDYGHEDQLGLEETPEEYVYKLTTIFNEVNRVLKNDGTLWLNLGDTYSATRWSDTPSTTGISGNHSDVVTEKKAGLPDKNLCMIPARVAMSLQANGWFLRSDIIWHKPNPMPESVKDRPTNAHEHIFLLSKSKKYYYDHEAIMEEANYDGRNDTTHKGSEKYEDINMPGMNPQSLARGNRERWPNKKDGKRMKNKRDVWSINTKPFPEAHFAVYPPELIAPCIKAGSKPDDIVLDPFYGSGTTGEVCKRLNRYYLGIELNKDYKPIQDKRTSQNVLKL